jgi:hypothetical protein
MFEEQRRLALVAALYSTALSCAKEPTNHAGAGGGPS